MKLYLRSRQNELSAKVPAGLNFSKRIASKYSIFRKTGRLPSLIFLRLSGVRAKNKNLDPVHRISINIHNLINSRKEIFLGTSGKGMDFRKSLYYSLNVDRSGDSMVARQPQKPVSFSGKDHPFRISKTHTRNFKFFSGHPEVFPQMLIIKPHEYVNKELYFENIGPEYKGNYKYLPTGIKPSYNEIHSSESAPVAIMGRTSERTNEIRKNLLHIRPTIIRQAGMVLNSANAMSYPQRVFQVAYLGSKPRKIIHPLAHEPEERLTSSTKIVDHIFIGTDSASTKSDTLSYPKNRMPANITLIYSNPEVYKNLPEEDRKTGKNPPGSHFISRPLKISFNAKNIISKSNCSIHHFVSTTKPSNVENQSRGLSHIKVDGSSGIWDITEKGTELFQQRRSVTNTSYENIIKEYEKTGRKNTINQHHGGKILKSTSDKFSELFFPEVLTGDISHNSSTELILKKPAVQKTEIISENKAQTEKTPSRNKNDTLIRESFKEKSQYEINRIADTVYKIIEKRISIEKDRRGLF
jgi:hypothetical protein